MDYPGISATISEADKAAIVASIDSIKALLPFVLNLTPAQRRKIRKLSPKFEGYVNGAYGTSSNFSSVIPSNYPFAAFTDNQSLNIALQSIEELLISLTESVKDTRMVLGHQRISHADNCYNYLQKAATGNAPLTEAVKVLAAFYSKAPYRKPVAYTIPIGSSLTINKVRTGTMLANTGNTVVKFKCGSLLSGKPKDIFILVSPGDAESIPAGWTSIEVTNMSTTAEGSFTVKLQ